MKSHLVVDHEISKDSPRQERVIQRQRTIQEAIALGQANPRKRRYVDTEMALDTTADFTGSINPDTLERLYIDFQTSCNLPIRFVQCTAFRNLVRYLNPIADDLLPESPSTAKSLLIAQFSQAKEGIRQYLQASQTAIHLSINAWTASNHLPILGVIGHTITASGQLEEFVIALRVIKGRHTRENLASMVFNILEEYSITNKLGYIQIDNASNNNTLMAALSSSTLPYKNHILEIY